MRSVVLFSGGLDSTVLLWARRAAGDDVLAVSVNYGQRHHCELQAAIKLTTLCGLTHEVVDVSDIGRHLPGNSQTDCGVSVPEGHYAAESMKKTVVPNRNMMMLSIAAAVGISRGMPHVWYAAHGGDHAIYPDCRPEFVAWMDGALETCDWDGVKLHAPFLKMTKGEVVNLGVELRVPFSDTWSCYQGLGLHCGKCGTCVERREAFAEAAVLDPTTYER